MPGEECGSLSEPSEEVRPAAAESETDWPRVFSGAAAVQNSPGLAVQALAVQASAALQTFIVFLEGKGYILKTYLCLKP